MGFLNKISLYYLIIIFLISLYILGIFSFGFAKVFWQFSIPVLTTIISGSLLDYLKYKRWQLPLSEIISGLIIGLTCQFGEAAWKLILIAVSAMLIKSFIRWENRHIFNPAASGLLVGMLFLNSSPAWWGGEANPWIFLIWIPILLYKQRRWTPMIGFLIPLVLFNGINSLTSGSLLFFISVMLIEPKTSPLQNKLGLFYGLIVALSFVLLARFLPDGLTPALLIGNLGARLLKLYLI